MSVFNVRVQFFYRFVVPASVLCSAMLGMLLEAFVRNVGHMSLTVGLTGFSLGSHSVSGSLCRFVAAFAMQMNKPFDHLRFCSIQAKAA